MLGRDESERILPLDTPLFVNNLGYLFESNVLVSFVRAHTRTLCNDLTISFLRCLNYNKN
jgi:hypothetical protein